MSGLKEECGVFGIYKDKPSIDLLNDVYSGLFALQHRGQESCGISYYNANGLEVIKSQGLVSRNLYKMLPKHMLTNVAMGHVRYSTCGDSNLQNAQPFLFNCNKGDVAIAHNGNIPNSSILKKELIQAGSIFQTTSDSEIIVHLLARIPGQNFESALISSLNQITGAFALLLLHNDELYAARDPFGFRPLSYGKVDGGYVFSSETNALDLVGAEYIDEVQPGELIICRDGKLTKKKFAFSTEKKQCVFELIYFSRPDSIIFNEGVHEARIKMGKQLAKLNKAEIDIIIAVPDSGNSAALGFSRASGIPLEYGFVRNHYTGRTFISPSQKKRTDGVRIKLNPITSVIKDKSIGVIDDSLVRGTTSSKIVKMLLDAGAKEVHLFLSSPEIKFSCYFGIDTPVKEELISSQLSPDEIAKKIGATSVTFLPVELLKKCVSKPNDYCYACFHGNYPMPIRDKPPVCTTKNLWEE